MIIDPNGEDVVILNPQTGEVYDTYKQGIEIRPLETVQQKRDWFQKKQQREQETAYIEKHNEQNDIEFGPFIWSVYENSKQLWPDIQPSFITMLMFLVTYMNYRGYLMTPNNQILAKSKLYEYLYVTKQTAYKFCSEMEKYKLLTFKDDKIFPNPNLFKKDRLDAKFIGMMAENGCNITRLYVEGVRSLYLRNLGVGVKRLSCVFRILPFVNREYNIVCWNPFETDITKIQRMKVKDFADSIGLDSSNIQRLVEDLFEAKFILRDKPTRFIHYVVFDTMHEEDWGIYVNPNLYYAGSHPKEVEILGAFDQ